MALAHIDFYQPLFWAYFMEPQAPFPGVTAKCLGKERVDRRGAREKGTCFPTGTGENNGPQGKGECQVHSLLLCFIFPFFQPLSCPAFHPCSESGLPLISCSAHGLCPCLHAYSHPLPGINKRPKNTNCPSACPYAGTDFVF